MKIIVLLCFFSVLAMQATAQNKSKFVFWISSIDKASYSRTTYHISKDSIIVKKGPYDFVYFAKEYPKDSVVYRIALKAADRKELNNIGETLKTESIKKIYDNLCIIDGMILHFHFEWPDLTKSTTVANYYQPLMEPVIQFINKQLYQGYHLWYDKDHLLKLMKDCPPKKILD